MSYIFSRTEGEAQEHLFPRYTRDEENQDLFATYQEMLDMLGMIYKNQYYMEDSRLAYWELQISPTQSFQSFKTQFLQLANGGRIPGSKRFDDLYKKLTTALRGQLLNQRYDLDKDFNKLCQKAGRIDVDLKRLNTCCKKENEACLGQNPALSPVRASNMTTTRPAFQYLSVPAASAQANTRATSAGFSLL
jgi:hypothetical protein